MSDIGSKIREIRKKKGLSQEELAELASVNLRTIQRIEKNETEPRGTTMHLICGALGISAEDILDHGKQIDKSYLVFFHLSVISFLAIPVGNIILPLILWLTKKDKVIGLSETGANVLNFQIAWTVLSFLAIVAYAFFKIMHYPGAVALFYVFVGLYILNIVFPVVAALRVKNGKQLKVYPNLISFIK